MSRRDIVVFLLGAASAVVVTLAVNRQSQPWIGAAQAQSPSDRLLVLGIANALSSLAVDSERTALGLNEVIDRAAILDDRLHEVEKRLEALERKR